LDWYPIQTLCGMNLGAAVENAGTWSAVVVVRYGQLKLGQKERRAGDVVDDAKIVEKRFGFEGGVQVGHRYQTAGPALRLYDHKRDPIHHEQQQVGTVGDFVLPVAGHVEEARSAGRSVPIRRGTRQSLAQQIAILGGWHVVVPDELGREDSSRSTVFRVVSRRHPKISQAQQLRDGKDVVGR